MLERQRRAASALHGFLSGSPAGGLIRRGWAYAAAGYFGAIVLYVIAQFLVNALFNLGGATATQSLVLLFGAHMLITSLGLVGCVNLAVRGYDHAAAGDRPLFAWAVTGSALLAPVLVVFELLGLIGEVAVGGPGGVVLYGVLVQLAGVVIAAVAGAWALSWTGSHAQDASVAPPAV
jgi:hypothetical protein